MHAHTAIMPPEKKKASLYVLVISLRKPRKIKINQKHKLARFSMKDIKEFKIKAKSSVSYLSRNYSSQAFDKYR